MGSWSSLARRMGERGCARRTRMGEKWLPHVDSQAFKTEGCSAVALVDGGMSRVLGLRSASPTTKWSASHGPTRSHRLGGAPPRICCPPASPARPPNTSPPRNLASPRGDKEPEQELRYRITVKSPHDASRWDPTEEVRHGIRLAKSRN